MLVNTKLNRRERGEWIAQFAQQNVIGLMDPNRGSSMVAKLFTSFTQVDFAFSNRQRKRRKKIHFLLSNIQPRRTQKFIKCFYTHASDFAMETPTRELSQFDRSKFSPKKASPTHRRTNFTQHLSKRDRFFRSFHDDADVPPIRIPSAQRSLSECMLDD